MKILLFVLISLSLFASNSLLDFSKFDSHFLPLIVDGQKKMALKVGKVKLVDLGDIQYSNTVIKDKSKTYKISKYTLGIAVLSDQLNSLEDEKQPFLGQSVYIVSYLNDKFFVRKTIISQIGEDSVLLGTSYLPSESMGLVISKKGNIVGIVSKLLSKYNGVATMETTSSIKSFGMNTSTTSTSAKSPEKIESEK